MPAVFFTVRLPDGTTKDCYSPSSVVRRYFTAGEELTAAEFVARSRQALTEASERVRAKFGFACTSAAAQLAEIERWTGAYPGNARIRILNL